MAEANFSLPKEILQKFENAQKHSQTMFFDMLRAAADVVLVRVRQNLPAELKKIGLEKRIVRSKPYLKKDGTAAAKVMVVDGYVTNSSGRKAPAAIIANMYEYGRKGGTSKKTGKKIGTVSARPFFRRSFVESEIVRAMEQVQEEYLGKGGPLDI